MCLSESEADVVASIDAIKGIMEELQRLTKNHKVQLGQYQMGYIKEPEGVDFIINGEPLTDQQKQAISEFIKADKAERALRSTRHKTKNGRNFRQKHPA